MSEYASLLKDNISRSGYSIFTLAERSGINRTTLQKILSGQRKMTDAVWEKLRPFLQLTPDEAARLGQLRFIDSIGEKRYRNHMLVKSIFEAPATSDQLKTDQDLLTFVGQENPPGHLTPAAETGISGRQNVLMKMHLYLASRERAGKIRLRVFSDFQNDFIASLASSLSRLPDPDLQILVPFSKMQESENRENTWNLNILRHIVRFCMTEHKPYSIRYYYHSEGYQGPDAGIALPFYVASDDFLILMSSDFEYAYLTENPSLCQLWMQHFEGIYEKCSLLTAGELSTTDFLAALIQCDTSPSASCLDAQPSVEIFITPNMIRKYMKDLTAGQRLVSMLEYRQTQITESLKKTDSSHEISYFTREGLDLFLKEGRCVNIPEDIARPFDREDRIRLLSACLEAPDYHPVMLDDRKFRAGSQLTIIPALPNQLLIILYAAGHRQTLIRFTEQSCFYSVNDFISSLPLYHYGLTEQETADYILREIKKIRG